MKPFDLFHLVYWGIAVYLMFMHELPLKEAIAYWAGLAAALGIVLKIHEHAKAAASDAAFRRRQVRRERERKENQRREERRQQEYLESLRRNPPPPPLTEDQKMEKHNEEFDTRWKTMEVVFKHERERIEQMSVGPDTKEALLQDLDNRECGAMAKLLVELHKKWGIYHPMIEG